MIYNPRYVAFAEAHGNTPETQMILDEIRWPGGVMCGFILWIAAAKEKYRDQFPRNFIGPHIHKQGPWTEFLQQLGKQRTTFNVSHPDDITANRHGGSLESDAAFERILSSLSDTKRRVLAACFRPGGVSCRELAEEWEVGLNVISGRFSQLKRDNLIIKHEIRDGSAAYVPNPSKFPHAPRQSD